MHRKRSQKTAEKGSRNNKGANVYLERKKEIADKTKRGR